MDGFGSADPSTLIIASRVDFVSRSSVCPLVPSCGLTCADNVTAVVSVARMSSGDMPVLLIAVLYLALSQGPCHSENKLRNNSDAASNSSRLLPRAACDAPLMGLLRPKLGTLAVRNP